MPRKQKINLEKVSLEGMESSLHPDNLSAKEWRLINILAEKGSTWPFYMTHEEYAIAREAIDRVKAEKTK